MTRPDAFTLTPRPPRRGLQASEKGLLALALFAVLGAAALVADALAARDGHTPRQFARDPAAYPAQPEESLTPAFDGLPTGVGIAPTPSAAVADLPPASNGTASSALLLGQA